MFYPGHRMGVRGKLWGDDLATSLEVKWGDRGRFIFVRYLNTLRDQLGNPKLLSNLDWLRIGSLAA